jgi:dTDP-4-amino-4,6-dideoxygalactose transaminase
MNTVYTGIFARFTSEADARDEFCEKAKRLLKVKHAIPVANGTVAIEVAIKALELARGSSVIVPDISFFATATAVANCGMVPVFGDISAQHFGLTLAEVKAKHTPKVKAVIVVHFAGVVNREISAIAQYCKENGLKLIEDCAQAFFCKENDTYAGTFGDVGTFSFQTSKLINCGEGGLVIANADDIANNCNSLANWGQLRPGSSERNLQLPCGNFRMSGYLCYFLSKQIDRIDEIAQNRLDMVKLLDEEFSSQGIQPMLPERNSAFLDIPFFFAIASTKKYHTVEPRQEHPLRKSLLVHSILRTQYPDLLDSFLQQNQGIHSEWTSDRVLASIDFINIRQLGSTLPSEIAAKYKN